jgi:hypothetical protein
LSAALVILDPAAAERRQARRGIRLQRLAVVLAVAAILDAVGLVALSGASGNRFAITLDLVIIGFIGSIVLFPVVGALIAQRRPFNRVAWVMIFIGLALGIGLLLVGYGVLALDPGRPLPLAVESLIVSKVFFIPAIGSGTAILLLLFPTDRLPSPPWRWVVAVAVVGAVLYDLGTIFQHGMLGNENVSGPPNPLGVPVEWAQAVQSVADVGNALVTLAVVLAAGSVVVRYRKAEAIEAAQIRWIALVAALAAPAFVVAALQLDDRVGFRVSDFAFGLGLVLLACLPIAIGFAITRYRLYEIDRLINRALVYGSLTAILAGIFTAAIGLAQRVFVATTGQSSDAAIVLTTLVVATLYAPLRKRLEAVVDRHFKYDERRFGAYRDEILRVLGIVDADRAASRLAAEAVRELQASGAVVLDAADRPVATAGAWPVEPLLRLRIPGGTRRLAAIAVGPRVDGRPHDPRAIAQLTEVVGLAGTAVGARRLR